MAEQARWTVVRLDQRLNSLEAACDPGGVLRDRYGIPIVILEQVGCWGNPPEDYQRLLQDYHQKVIELRRSNVVIVLPCNPFNQPID